MEVHGGAVYVIKNEMSQSKNINSASERIYHPGHTLYNQSSPGYEKYLNCAWYSMILGPTSHTPL